MGGTVNEAWSPESMEWVLLLLGALFAVMALLLTFGGRGGERSKRLSWLACACCFSLLLARAWVLEPFYVPTPSMAPTLLEGDLLLVQKYPYRLSWPIGDEQMVKVGQPQRGDVVVFTLPSDPSTRYVKRVLGVPGDDVVLLDGVWHVNGKSLEPTPRESFGDIRGGKDTVGRSVFSETLAGRRYETIAASPSQPHAMHWKVPDGHVFVLGDNRGMSLDSRDFGMVRDELVVGRVGRLLVNLKGLDRWFFNMSVPSSP